MLVGDGFLKARPLTWPLTREVLLFLDSVIYVKKIQICVF